jgi:hypothetical protein
MQRGPWTVVFPCVLLTIDPAIKTKNRGAMPLVLDALMAYCLAKTFVSTDDSQAVQPKTTQTANRISREREQARTQDLGVSDRLLLSILVQGQTPFIRGLVEQPRQSCSLSEDSEQTSSNLIFHHFESGGDWETP